MDPSPGLRSSGTTIARPLTLPCGLQLENRLAKAALTERLSDARFGPSPQLVDLYRGWARSGAGLLITGNVMIDRRHLESAGNVVLEDDRALPALREWASTTKDTRTHLFVQLSHPGRQSSIFSRAAPVCATGTGSRRSWRRPRALTSGGVEEIVERFANAASCAQRAGFAGVQVHAAHGYLLSRFLSPRTNRRVDRFGGSPRRRARLLLWVVRAIRGRVGRSFPISVKLNSADLRRGGFCEDEALDVVRWLADASVDLLEISGGSYENMAFLRPESREHEEVYFLDFARRAKRATAMPLMLTGGFRSRASVERVLRAGVIDVAGMGRPFLGSATFGQDFLSGRIDRAPVSTVTGVPRWLVHTAIGGLHDRQVRDLAAGRDTPVRRGGLGCALQLPIRELTHFLTKALRAPDRD